MATTPTTPIGGKAVTNYLKAADAAALARMTGASSVSRLLNTPKKP